MMKELANIVLLLVVIALVVLRSMGGENVAEQADLWIMVVCITATVVNAALAIAGSLTRRPILSKVVWAGAFFVLGCALWTARILPTGTEEDLYNTMRRNAQTDPYALDEEGESLFTRAASLGKRDELVRMINAKTPDQGQLVAAGMRAAEGNHVDVLEELARVGLNAAAVWEGTPLLHAAAQNGRCEALRWLVMRGASVNMRDEAGSTALIQAVQSGSEAAVKLLLELGADAKLRDATGLRAEDYARSGGMHDLLAPTKQ